MPIDFSETLVGGFFVDGDNQTTRDTDQSLLAVDLLCEGPIEGLVNNHGDLLKYFKDEKYSNALLAKGIYYNDTPLIDNQTDLYNFVARGYEFFNGEDASHFWDYPSTTYRYNQRIYGAKKNYDKILYQTGGKGAGISFTPGGQSYFFHPFASKANFYRSYVPSIRGSQMYSWVTDYWMFGGMDTRIGDPITADTAGNLLTHAKLNASVFSHRIRNRYTDDLTVNFNADQCFTYNKKGDVKAHNLDFCIEIYKESSNERIFLVIPINFISRGNRTIPVKINLNLDPFTEDSHYVNVFMLSKRVPPTDGQTQRVAFVDSVVETVRRKGKFSYPHAVVCKSVVSSEHFKSDPARTFHIKGLKVKVPSNYDPKAKEYHGNWDGNFSKFLKWTDNPAWIYYDICTNQRYGVGTGNVLTEDLNKWELYKIAKYCDELIKITKSQVSSEDDFTYYPEMSNCVFIEKASSGAKKTLTLQDVHDKYKPFYNLEGDDLSSNLGDKVFSMDVSRIFLFDINNKEVANSKKIIWSIAEGILIDHADGTKSFEQTLEGEGAVFKLVCGKDFSSDWFLENSPSNISDYVFRWITGSIKLSEDLELSKDINEMQKQLRAAGKNSEGFVQHLCMRFITSHWHMAGYEYIKNTYVEGPLFEGDASQVKLQGRCLPTFKFSKDILEERFSANLYIDNETEVLKLLNDIASVFRGLTYYRNNLITTTIDVSKPVSYLFNNTNVKDGMFTYSTGSIDGNYSVAKVLYRDKRSNFDESVESVEDAQLVKEFGIVSKEILGFGVTSREQARRMGLWLLSTNRFENQTVTFTTDIQGLLLKPGDVIKIEDSFKSQNILQGRVVSLNLDESNDRNNYIIVDRKISSRFAGEKIKFLCNRNKMDIDNVESSDQYDKNLDSYICELTIDRIENNTNKIYFRDVLARSEDRPENFLNFHKLSVATPFVIEGKFLNSSESSDYLISEDNSNEYSDNKNLYKIVSISEQDINEYGIFAVKYDRNKYLSLDKNVIKIKDKNSENKVSYSTSQNITELDLSGLGNSYYEINRLTFGDLSDSDFDFSFSDSSSYMHYSDLNNYASLNLKFSSIVDYVISQADNGSEYYREVFDILNLSGGFICKIISKNQSIRFKVPFSSVSDKSVFLGRYPKAVDNSEVISLQTNVKIYLYDKNNKIVEV